MKKVSRTEKSTSRECVQGGPMPVAALPASLGDAAPANRGAQPLVNLRPYQRPIFQDRTAGIVILHWSRQIGKSFTLGAWAVDRLLTQLQKYPTWLITVLSNSRDNGAEFVLKCAEVLKLMGLAQATLAQERAQEIGDANVFVEEDQSPDPQYQNMRMEIRITIGGRVGRIKVLAANPRTARGFSGDLILDEFAFHEDSNAIWEAAEPILSANPEFLCRIASTGNGKYNMFYRMVSSGSFKVSRVSRTDAWRQGVKIYDPNTRAAITPERARAKALDKRAYDQNYELAFNDENTALLTHELISAAERSPIAIDEQHWSGATLERLAACKGDLFAGNDIGRHRDLSVCWILEKEGVLLRTAGILRMSGMRLPTQQEQLDKICRLPKFRRYAGDLTGIGVGLVEYLQEEHGDYQVRGVNFATTEPVSDRMRSDGTKRETARVTEIMATDLLSAFEDRAIEIPSDMDLREDLRKPEKVVSPGGRVSIAAVRDEAGHADHFWALALAIRAAKPSGVAFSAALI
jgi:phage FluMu gp28-like protein